MTTTKRASALAALALAVALGGVASAQGVTPASDPGDTHIVEVTFGGYVYELFADEPVQACVISREEDRSGASLAYRLFVREDDGSFSSVGQYPTPAIGALTDAQFGDCVSLDGGTNAS